MTGSTGRLQRAGVTAREAEVLELLGDQLTNAEIAERLHISVRTVESHVSALLAKLGATERRQLGRMAGELRRTPVPSLPRYPTTFVGRGAEIGELRNLLDRRRVVTLVGPPGVGKTRLAIEAARCWRRDAGTRTWFVDLAPLRASPASDAINDLVVLALDAAPRPGRSLHETVASTIGTTPGLVLLDNCEHVVEEALVVIGDLLAAAPEARVMATSREPLSIAGEAVYEIEPLAFPARGDEAPVGIGGIFPAVDLFVDRAAAASAEFVLTATNAAAVTTLCRRLDGLPLAIELAAARVRTFPTNELVTHLDARFDLLTSGPRTADRRHRTLREAVDWSYETLGDAERVVFDRLGVFPSSFDFDAAAAVSGADDGLAGTFVRLLPAVVDKSLVTTSGGESGRRYRLLETLRTYAAERLVERGEDRATRDRHRDWYLAVAEQATGNLRGPDSPTWLARLDDDYENMRAALEWALENGAGEIGLRFGDALWRYWDVRGRYAEGLSWLQQFLDASPDAPAELRADAWLAVDALATGDGDYDLAAEAHTRSLALAEELGDQRRVARALNGRGTIAWRRGDFDTAAEAWTEMLSSCRRRGERPGVCSGLNNLAVVRREQGRYDEASALLEQSLGLYRERGDDDGVALVLFNRAQIDAVQGAYGRAADALTTALRLWEDVGNLHGIAKVTAVQAGVDATCGRYANADVALERSVAIAAQIGDRQRLAVAIRAQGDVAHLGARTDAAIARYDEALVLFRELGELPGIADALTGLAAATPAPDVAGAEAFGREALDLYRRMGNRLGIASAQLELSCVAVLRREHDGSEGLARVALAGFRRLGCPLGVARCLEALAGCSLRRRDRERSAALLTAAGSLRDAIGAPVAPVHRPAIEALRSVVDNPHSDVVL